MLGLSVIQEVPRCEVDADVLVLLVEVSFLQGRFEEPEGGLITGPEHLLRKSRLRGQLLCDDHVLEFQAFLCGQELNEPDPFLSAEDYQEPSRLEDAFELIDPYFHQSFELSFCEFVIVLVLCDFCLDLCSDLGKSLSFGDCVRWISKDEINRTMPDRNKTRLTITGT